MRGYRNSFRIAIISAVFAAIMCIAMILKGNGFAAGACIGTISWAINAAVMYKTQEKEAINRAIKQFPRGAFSGTTTQEEKGDINDKYPC